MGVVDRLMKPKEVAERLNITVETLSRLRKKGRIRGYKLIRMYRYDIEEVKRALQQK